MLGNPKKPEIAAPKPKKFWAGFDASRYLNINNHHVAIGFGMVPQQLLTPTSLPC